MVLLRRANWACYALSVASLLGQSIGSTPTVYPGLSAVGELRLRELRANGVNYVGFKPPASVAANVVWELPGVDGSSSKCLGWASATTLDWVACGGSPAGATYITQTPDATLTAEQALSVLATGILKNTTTTGVLSIAVGADLPAHASRHASAGDDAVSLSATQITSGTLDDARLPSTQTGKTFTTNTIIGDGGDDKMLLAVQATDPGCTAGQYGLYASAAGLVGASMYTCTNGNPGVLGDVSTTASTTSGYVPTWLVTNGKRLAAGYSPVTAATADTLVLRGSLGEANFATVGATVVSATPTTDTAALTLRRGTSGQTQPIITISDELGNLLTSFVPSTGDFTGKAAGLTATLGLATGGTNQTSWTASRCVQVNAGGTALESAAAACGSGGGAPTDATYITQTANATLTAEQALGALATGIVKNTTTTGVLSIAVGADLPTHASRHGSAGDDAVTLNASQTTAGTFATGRVVSGTVTNSRCMRVDASGNVVVASADCAAGGTGDVVGPASSTADSFARFSGTTGKLLQNGIIGASGLTASTLMLRDANNSAVAYDKGGQVYNVKAYGATGDGATDDRSAIQAAIDASTYGGIVFFPPGDYLISTTHGTWTSCGLVIGTGTSTTYSSQNNIILQGSGRGVGSGISGDANAQRGTTRIRSGTSSATTLICTKGPAVGIWLKNMNLDGNSLSGTGLNIWHTTAGGVDDVNFRRFNTRGIDTGAYDDTAFAFGPCGNTFRDVDITEGGAAGFSGIRLTGADGTAAGVKTSCSDLISRVNIIFGGNSQSVGIELAWADNNRIHTSGVNAYTNVAVTGAADNGSGLIRVTHGSTTNIVTGGRGSINNVAGCPLANGPWVFTSISSTQTDLQGSSSTGCSYTSGGTLWTGAPILLSQQSVNTYPYGNVIDHVASSHSWWLHGTSGTGGNYVFNSTSENNIMPNMTDIHGAGDDGALLPKMYTLATLTSATGIFMRVKNGTIVGCSDCNHASNPCTSGGSGAIAKRLNNAWSCN